MTPEAIVERLEGVRRTAADRWIARCPAHGDRAPSLSVRGMSDGRTLLHCFSGCDFAEIVAALGLEPSDLFPDRAVSIETMTGTPAIPARDILSCVALEALVVADCARQLQRGARLSDADSARLATACGRLGEAAEMASPGRAAHEHRQRVFAANRTVAHA